MPVELSFAEMAAFGAIVAVLLMLVIIVLVVWLVARWVARHAAVFRELGIKRTAVGDVQFNGHLFGELPKSVGAADGVFGPTKFHDDPASAE